MKSILKRLKELADDELLVISEAVDVELESRLAREDELLDSARRRAVLRGQSYRRATGANAVPVKVNGVPSNPRRSKAA